MEGVTLTSLMREPEQEQSGALWRLRRRTRQLDANVVRFPAGHSVAAHTEAEVDVLVIVVAGGGTLTVGGGARELRPGMVVLVPRGKARGIDAGPDGLVLLTAHRRRTGLRIGRRSPARSGPPECAVHLVCGNCHRHAIEVDARYCSACGTPLPERRAAG
ncbi:zinc ribbon domain-containing protein [Streptomyces sp. NPDC101118]|uniref:zinc ribbon domain-containing protein n=1 Tax=Streptomyces sp. NPDC101118 TaxID=3366109 RepID=UPI00381D04C1